jgi:hypothetical protein
MDTITGILLLAAPLLTLRLMRISGVPLEPVYLRWIGAFVLASGVMYVYPFLPRAGAILRADRFQIVLEATTIIRVCVAATVWAAILARTLPAAWSSVGLTDAAIAAAQLCMIRHRVFHDHDA